MSSLCTKAILHPVRPMSARDRSRAYEVSRKKKETEVPSPTIDRDVRLFGSLVDFQRELWALESRFDDIRLTLSGSVASSVAPSP